MGSRYQRVLLLSVNKQHLWYCEKRWALNVIQNYPYNQSESQQNPFLAQWFRVIVKKTTFLQSKVCFLQERIYYSQCIIFIAALPVYSPKANSLTREFALYIVIKSFVCGIKDKIICHSVYYPSLFKTNGNFKYKNLPMYQFSYAYSGPCCGCSSWSTEPQISLSLATSSSLFTETPRRFQASWEI